MVIKNILTKPKLKFSKLNLLIFALVFASIGGYTLWRAFGASSPTGDLNGDGTVNILDLSILLSNYNTTASSADINNDGVVNILDLSILLSNYGSSAPVTGSTTINPPIAPQAYTLPTSAVAVSTTAALQSALNGSTRDIILENGDYTNSTYLTIGTHRLWARNLGGATLHFGLELGANASGTGPEIHGIKFDVTSTNTTFDGDIIYIWSDAGANAVITDSWFYGHNVLDAGILTYVTSGFKVQRVVVSGFQSYGIFFETYSPEYLTDNPSVIPIVSDADISAISRPTPGSSDGTAEAGIWAGTNAQVSRIKIRNTGWMGIWTGGNANNGVYSDFDIDQTGAAVYLEHYSRSDVFKNFVIGNATNTGVEIGFVCEWADPDYAGSNPVAGQSIAACHYNTMQDGTIYSSDRGFSLEDADHTTIQRIKFVGQSHAAIDDFMTSGTGYSTSWQGLGNDFSGILPGAVQYSTQHF